MYLLHALYVTRTTWIGTFTTHAGTYRVFGTFFECQCLVVANCYSLSIAPPILTILVLPSGIPCLATVPLKHGKAAIGRLALAPSDLVEYTSLNSLSPITNWLV